GGFDLTKTGVGTLFVGWSSQNSSNTYSGTTRINAGTLQLNMNNVMPRGGNVVVEAGATFNIGSTSNGTTSSSSNAIGTVTLNGGTFRVPSGNGDYHINGLVFNGGAVDFTGTGNFW